MLKKTLLTLLQRQNSEKLIQACLKWSPYHIKSNVDRDSFVHLFRNDNLTFTLDQIANIQKLLETSWKAVRVDSVDYKYSKTPSLFNAILRFSEDTLFDRLA